MKETAVKEREKATKNYCSSITQVLTLLGMIAVQGDAVDVMAAARQELRRLRAELEAEEPEARA